MKIETTKQIEQQMKVEMGCSQTSWHSLTKDQQSKIWHESFVNVNDFVAVMNGKRVYNV